MRNAYFPVEAGKIQGRTCQERMLEPNFLLV